MRKMAQTFLNTKEIVKILPLQNAEATHTMFQILNDPAGYYEYFRRYSTGVVLASVYGQRAADPTSDKIQRIYSIMERFTSLVEPGATPPVDTVTFLQYLPDFMCSWKRKAKAIRRDELDLYQSLVAETKRKLASGLAPDCFLAHMLNDREKHGISDEWLAYIAGLFVGPTTILGEYQSQPD